MQLNQGRLRKKTITNIIFPKNIQRGLRLNNMTYYLLVEVKVQVLKEIQKEILCYNQKMILKN